MLGEGRQNTNQKLSARGRDRQSERGRAVGRGRRKKKHGQVNAENSSDDGSNSNYEQKMKVEKLEGTSGVRKVSFDVSYLSVCVLFIR